MNLLHKGHDVIQNDGLKQWCDVFNGLCKYRSCVNKLGQSGINNSYLAGTTYIWENRKVKCEPENGISVGCTIRRSRFGAMVLAITDNTTAKYAGVIEGSVLMEINGVVVIMESFQSIYRRLEALINIPVSLRFIHSGRVYDVVFWEQDMGIVWCGASDLAQVESLVENGLAVAAGVKAGDIIIGLDDLTTKELNYSVVVERLRTVKDKSTCIEFTGPREVPSISVTSITTPLSLFIDTPVEKNEPGSSQIIVRHSTILRGVEETGRTFGNKRPSQNDSYIDKFFFMQRWRPADAMFYIKLHSNLKLSKHDNIDRTLCRHCENILEHLSKTEIQLHMLQLTQLLRDDSLTSQFFDPLSQPLYIAEGDNDLDTSLFEVHMSGYSTPSTSGIMPSMSNNSLSSFISTDQISVCHNLSSYLIESCYGNITNSNKLFWNLRSNIIINDAFNTNSDEIISSTIVRRSSSCIIDESATSNMFLDALMVMMSRLMKAQHDNWHDWRYQLLYFVLNGVSTNSMLSDTIENIVCRGDVEKTKEPRAFEDINIRNLYETVIRYEACGKNKASFDGSICNYPDSVTTSPSNVGVKNDEDRFGIFKGVLPWFTNIFMSKHDEISIINEDDNNDVKSDDDTYSETWRDCEGERNRFSPIDYDDTESVTSTGSSRPNEYFTPKQTSEIASSRDSYDDSLGLDDTLIPLDNNLFFASMFSKQCALIDVIRTAVKSVHANITESQDNREERLRNTLNKLTAGRKNFWPIASPLHPNDVLLTGLDIPNCRLLKSSKYPAILAFTSVTNDDFEEIAPLTSPRRKKYNISLANLSISMDPTWEDITTLHCRCFIGSNVIRDVLVSLNNINNRLELLNQDENIILECVEEHPPTTFLILLSTSSIFEGDNLLGECWISLLDVWSDLVATESSQVVSVQLELPVCPPHWVSDSAMFHTNTLFPDNSKELSIFDEEGTFSQSFEGDRMSSPLTIKSDNSKDIIITPLKAHVYGLLYCNSVETTIKKAIIRKEMKLRSKFSPYKMLYKREDDVRQDEFVLQLIKLMDSMLKDDGLDLKLCIYEVVTVGQREGIIEWVNGAVPLSSIIQEYGSNGERNPIQAFLRRTNFSPHDPYFINSNVMDTYLRSCAGYSVITYILGVGDRHLDNLLMKSSGEFMHVDFGYMFGRDPKPFKPQLRFTQEMLLAMGGEDSPLYEKFLEYCCLSYNIIRRSSAVLLSYLRLTCHVGISDLSVKQYPADAILAVSDRLHLELDDSRAFGHMRSVIADSQSAVMPVVMEQMHRIASVWR